MTLNVAWTQNKKQTNYYIVVGVMKMGNTVPRVGLETTSLTFWATVLPLHHMGVKKMGNIMSRMGL